LAVNVFESLFRYNMAVIVSPAEYFRIERPDQVFSLGLFEARDRLPNIMQKSLNGKNATPRQMKM